MFLPNPHGNEDKTSPENSTFDTRTRRGLALRLFRLIRRNSLEKIKEILEPLQSEQRIAILNTTIQGFLLLFRAVKLNKVEISRYLITHSLPQGLSEMSDHWKLGGHPLIAAINVGNSELIELILQHLPNINDKIRGPFSPLLAAVFLGDLTSVKLIVARRADINRPWFQKRTPLMYSTVNNKICKFLLSKRVKINQQDEDGFTALHLAVSWNQIQSVKHLVKAGADVKLRSCEGITPLYYASINMNMPIMSYLLEQPAYSYSEMINALELLNAASVCTQNSAIDGWAEALLMRKKMNLPKNCQIPIREILDNSQEFTAKTELENLKDNPLHLAYQSILIVERIFGRNNSLYIQFLLQTALIAEHENNKEKVCQLIEHIQDDCHEISFVISNLWYFKNLFYAIAKCNDPIEFFKYGGFAIFKIIAQTAVEMWFCLEDDIYIYPSYVNRDYSELVDAFLYMMSEIHSRNLSPQHLHQFREKVKLVLLEDLRVLNHQSILHRALKLTKKKWASVELIRFLLESGADVNTQDYCDQTPMMYAFMHVPINIRIEVLELLAEYRRHPIL